MRKLSASDLQKWGAANKVTFEPDKQHMSIISVHEPEGEHFKIMGILASSAPSSLKALVEAKQQKAVGLPTLQAHPFSFAELIDDSETNLQKNKDWDYPKLHGTKVQMI